MIRGTVNGGTSSLSKKRFDVLKLINNGVGGESFEHINVIADGSPGERRDAIDDHAAAISVFPSNSFNGTFE